MAYKPVSPNDARSGVTLLLLQTLWCGGIWIVGYLVIPMLKQTGGAREGLVTLLFQVMVALALVCTLLMLLSVLFESGMAAWRQPYEQLLAAGLILQVACLLAVNQWPAGVPLLQGMLALLALLIVIYSVRHLREA